MIDIYIESYLILIYPKLKSYCDFFIS